MMLRRMMLRRKTDPKTGKHTLCEPAQSKCTWTFHKSHFVWKFTGTMPDAPETTSIKHRAFTLTVRTPQCGHSVWGTKEQKWMTQFSGKHISSGHRNGMAEGIRGPIIGRVPGVLRVAGRGLGQLAAEDLAEENQGEVLAKCGILRWLMELMDFTDREWF